MAKRGRWAGQAFPGRDLPPAGRRPVRDIVVVTETGAGGSTARPAIYADSE
jgi:hypothetical protein